MGDILDMGYLGDGGSLLGAFKLTNSLLQRHNSTARKGEELLGRTGLDFLSELVPEKWLNITFVVRKRVFSKALMVGINLVTLAAEEKLYLMTDQTMVLGRLGHTLGLSASQNMADLSPKLIQARAQDRQGKSVCIASRHPSWR